MSYIQRLFTSRDNNADAATFVGQQGRIWWNPDTNNFYYSDGSTPGGIPIGSGGGGNGSPGGSNGQVQFNYLGNFGGSANLTFNAANGALTAVSFIGDGSQLANITGANVTGTVANATYATSAGSATTAVTVTANAQPNITSVGTLTSLTSTGNITGNYFIGNGSLLTGIVSSYSNSNVSNYLASGTDNANIITTGNVTGSNLTTSGLISATGNITGGNVNVNSGKLTGGSLSVLGGVTGGSLSTAGTLGVTGNASVGNLRTAGEVSASGNITASYYFGNGSQLTGIVTSSYSNSNVSAYLASGTETANIITTGNISGTYILGNGSQLTGIVSSYGNSNVVANLAALGSNPISTTGNISAGNVIATNITTTNGNLYGNNGTYNNPNFITPFIGDGDWAYGLYSNGSVVFTQTKFWGGGDTAHGYRVYDTFGAGNTRFSVDGTGNTNLESIKASGSISAAGNITANYYIGNGSQLTGIVSSYGNSNVAAYLPTYTGNLVALTGNVTTTANISGNYILGNGSQLTGITSSYGNSNVVANLAALGSNPISTTGNVTSGNLLTSGLISATGNITGGNLIGSVVGNVSGNISGNTASLSGNITGGNILTNGLISAAGNITSAANISGGNLLTGGLVSVTGNITSSANISGGNLLTGGLVSVAGNITSAANISGGNLLTAGLISSTGNITSSGNVSGGNLLTGGSVSATGNITAGGNANYYGLAGITKTITAVAPTTGVAALEVVGSAGNGVNINLGNVSVRHASIETDATRTLTLNVNVLGTANAVSQAVAIYPNLNASFSNAVSATGNISSAGNITGGNLLTGGLISATGNITSAANISGGNLLSGGLVSITGNITSAANISGGNLLSGGLVSITGNITSAANISGGNLLTVGQISTSGNVSGGNAAALTAVVVGNVANTSLQKLRFVTTGTGVFAQVGNGVTGSTGNITFAPYFQETAAAVIDIATGNITGGNLLTSGRASVTGMISVFGNINSTGVAIGNGAVNNVALGYFPTTGTKADMAIRDYSDVGSTMYFDNSIGSANVTGVFRFRGSNAFTTWAVIDQYGVNQPTRPAFRVYGGGATNITATNTLNGNNWVVDYNQGNYLNSSTGVFTAPVAGLYQVNLIARYQGNVSTSAILVRKTAAAGGTTTQAYVEWAGNSTAFHMGGGTVAKLAVNDTLTVVVVSGSVTFDANDSWSVAYIG